MTFMRIIPRFKLLLTYDIRADALGSYQSYILDEFIPAMQGLNLYMVGAWHTAYGDYPIRQIEFVVEDLDTLQQAYADPRWLEHEARLKAYTLGLERKVVRFRQGWQF